MIQILNYSLFSQILPAFLLIFVLVFAVLQRAKILGENNSTNALISLAVALMFIFVPFARDFVVGIMPFLAIALAVMLVFFILLGFVVGDQWNQNKWIKPVFGILIGIFLVAVILFVSGWWNLIANNFTNILGPNGWAVIILIVIIGGAVALVWKKK